MVLTQGSNVSCIKMAGTGTGAERGHDRCLAAALSGHYHCPHLRSSAWCYPLFFVWLERNVANQYMKVIKV